MIPIRHVLRAAGAFALFLAPAFGCAGSDDGTTGDDQNATAGQQKHAVPTFPADTPYGIFLSADHEAHPMSDTARGVLLLQGWQPVLGPGIEAACGSGSEDDPRCKAHPEVEACAGSGEGNCVFKWRKNGTTIRVDTIDSPPVIRSTGCVSNCVPVERPALPVLKTNVDYRSTTRPTLLQQGWKPVVGPCCPGGSGVCSNGSPGVLECAQNPEVVDCAGVGEGDCTFVWIKNQTVIQVNTVNDPPICQRTSCRANCK